MHIERTKTGTLLYNGIEYNELPAPECLVKAMSSEWAKKLVSEGILRMRHLSYYRNWEHDVLGDPTDGYGLYHLDGDPMKTDSANDVYALCDSFPPIKSDRLHMFAEQGDYDCMIIIRDVQVMFERIKNWFSLNLPDFWIHCGEMKYDKGAEVDKQTLNSQKFHFNVFQKHYRFEPDMEYRLSVTNTTFKKLTTGYIDLVLGDCSDVLTVEELPNKRIDS